MASQEEIANHTLELLKRIHAQQQTMGFDLQDVKQRITVVEEGIASLSARMATVEVSVVGVTKRLDRLDERLGRIERRLDLRDGADD